MANVNEVIYNGNTLISLKNDTVSAADVAQGKVFHLPSGESSVGTAQGGIVIDLLWTNPSPNNTYGGGTVSLDLSNYDAILLHSLCVTNHETTSPSYETTVNETNYIWFNNLVWIAKGTDAYVLMGGFKGVKSNQVVDKSGSYRKVTVSSTGVTFTIAKDVVDNSSQIVIAIPYKIYGVKGSLPS